MTSWWGGGIRSVVTVGAVVAAVGATAASVVQSVAVVWSSLIGSGLSGWLPWSRPLPFLVLAALAWFAARPWWIDRPVPAWVRRVVEAVRRVPIRVWFVAVPAIAALAWLRLQVAEPLLGHEEAVYANQARSWLAADSPVAGPAAGWEIYRPFGLPVVGWLGLTIHPEVGSLRFIALLLTCAMLVATLIVVSRWIGPRRAVVVALVVLSGLGFLRRVPEFLNDIAATGLLLIVVALIVRARERPDPRALLVLPVVVLLAFYWRYGVLGNLLAIGIAALVAYGPRWWAVHRRNVLIGLGILVAGLIPHLVYAIDRTGSPLGIVLSAAESSNRAYFGEGLVYYLEVIRYRLAGDLGAVLIIAGVLATVVAMYALWRSSGGEAARRRVFLGLSAGLTCVLFGITTHGEPRFIFLAVVLFTVLGVEAVSVLAGRWSRIALSGVAGLAVLAVPVTAEVIAKAEMPHSNGVRESVVPVAQRSASDRPCLLVTGYVPDMGWYSGCDAVGYGDYAEWVAEGRIGSDTVVRFVRFEQGRLQPGARELERLVGGRETTTRTIRTPGSLGTATVVTLADR